MSHVLFSTQTISFTIQETYQSHRGLWGFIKKKHAHAHTRTHTRTYTHMHTHTRTPEYSAPDTLSRGNAAKSCDGLASGRFQPCLSLAQVIPRCWLSGSRCSARVPQTCTPIYPYIYIYISIYMYIYIDVCAYIYIYIYICIDICIYICTHIFIHEWYVYIHMCVSDADYREVVA